MEAFAAPQIVLSAQHLGGCTGRQALAPGQTGHEATWVPASALLPCHDLEPAAHPLCPSVSPSALGGWARVLLVKIPGTDPQLPRYLSLPHPTKPEPETP